MSVLNSISSNGSNEIKTLSSSTSLNESRGVKIILVHGLHGNEKTWLNMQEQLKGQIENSSILQFKYKSGFKRIIPFASSSPKKDAEVLADMLRDDNFTGKYILCGHSEGGIIIALAIKILHEKKNTGILDKILCQFLLNSPMAGSLWANRFQFLPYIKSDLKVLKFGSQELKDLSDYFKRNFEFNENKKGNGLYYLPTWAICATDDKYVSRFSSSFGVPENQIKNVYGDHFSIVKPNKNDSEVLKYMITIINRLLNNSNTEIEDELPISKIYGENKNRYNLDDPDKLSQLINDFHKAHSLEEYETYYKMLSRYSLKLKKKGLHKELSEICELDINRKYSSSLYPVITFSQCKLITYDIQKSFDAIDKILKIDPLLDNWSPHTRLLMVRTYCEILNSNGSYELSVEILETFLSFGFIEKVKFKGLCQSLGILGKSYQGCKDIKTALELFEAIFSEQYMTADEYGIAIAEMNLGITHLELGNIDTAISMFTNSMNQFNGLDNRAFAWAQFNLAIAISKIGDKTNFKKYLAPALVYNSKHSQCSLDYLTNLRCFLELEKIEPVIHTKIQNELKRLSSKIQGSKLTDAQLNSARQLLLILRLRLGDSNIVKAQEKIVTRGWFKNRSKIVRTFLSSLEINRAVKYLEIIQVKNRNFSIHFYNGLLVAVCKRRKDLIQRHIIEKINHILDQTDSIKIFFARFLEAEHLLSECEKILEHVKNKKSCEYRNILGNLYSRRGKKFFDKAMAQYKEALTLTRIEKYQAQIYNNMAHLIHRYHIKVKFEEAILLCRKSIDLRSNINFYYPAALMLALRIELANVGNLMILIKDHKSEYGLNEDEIKYVLKKLQDNAKRKAFEKNLDSIIEDK